MPKVFRAKTLSGRPGAIAPASRLADEIGADYSGRRPNCNVTWYVTWLAYRAGFRRFLATILQGRRHLVKGAAQATAAYAQAPPKARRQGPRKARTADRSRGQQRHAGAHRRGARAARTRRAGDARLRRRRRLLLASGRPRAGTGAARQSRRDVPAQGH